MQAVLVGKPDGAVGLMGNRSANLRCVRRSNFGCGNIKLRSMWVRQNGAGSRIYSYAYRCGVGSEFGELMLHSLEFGDRAAKLYALACVLHGLQKNRL